MSLPSVQYIALPENRGPATARNAGWRKSIGKLIAFTDDDCLPQPGWLSAIWEAYENHGMPELIAFSGRIEVPLSVLPTDFEKNTSLLEEAEFVTANCSCTKTALNLVDGFDERFKAPWREDSDLQFKLIQNNVLIHKLNNAVVIHPVRKAGWGTSISDQKKTVFNALLYKKYPHLFRKKIQSSPAWNYYMIITAFAVMIIRVIQRKQTFVYYRPDSLCYTNDHLHY